MPKLELKHESGYCNASKKAIGVLITWSKENIAKMKDNYDITLNTGLYHSIWSIFYETCKVVAIITGDCRDLLRRRKREMLFTREYQNWTRHESFCSRRICQCSVDALFQRVQYILNATELLLYSTFFLTSWPNGWIVISQERKST